VKEVHLQTPLQEREVRDLRVGDTVYLTGIVLTARDMAHLRLRQLVQEGRSLPESMEGAVIFHAGPVVTGREGAYHLEVIGPTTSIRMEPHSDFICGLGVRAVVGKGGMGPGTVEAFGRHGAVYLHAAPGCAVKHSQAVVAVERAHWLELGMPEAMWVLRVRDWGPLVVGIDSHGADLVREIRERGAAIVAGI